MPEWYDHYLKFFYCPFSPSMWMLARAIPESYIFWLV
jgi:hypothetical protein